MDIVGLNGFAQVGKDTAGSHLVKHHGYTRYAFGDAVKAHVALLDVRLNGTLTLGMLLGRIDGSWAAASAHRVYGPEIVRTFKVYGDAIVRGDFQDTGRTEASLIDDLVTLDPFLDGGITVAQLLEETGGDWEAAKNHRFHGPEIRRLLQVYGTEIGRSNYGANVWTDYVARQISQEQPQAAVLTDVRFDSEAEWVLAQGGPVVRIHRPGTGPVNGHVSEKGLRPENITTTLINDKTPQNLGRLLDETLNLSSVELLAA
ncbi:hypothetical protein [Arthrobacter sp. A2-55]|uniref:deoxynucleotide monophosphate kinase family protein n=1 Tax=Arthrobacter sp. A2-55 TaxID=2897337 RepID=UPI0021CD8BEC|nr:hypothetical protein [Arthrobacter sp. A2-55]MCU6480547.1 hypothetical protein [Arthrobacter sp. A2-55]